MYFYNSFKITDNKKVLLFFELNVIEEEFVDYNIMYNMIKIVYKYNLVL